MHIARFGKFSKTKVECNENWKGKTSMFELENFKPCLDTSLVAASFVVVCKVAAFVCQHFDETMKGHMEFELEQPGRLRGHAV